MKKLRIAYVGVFDLKNYGDHLFPLIFEHEMAERQVDFELILFSNYDCRQTFEGNYAIHSVANMEQIHQQSPIDFVVIGGGEIIHPHAFKQTLEIQGKIQEVDYAMLNIWMKPMLFCQDYNVPCLLNGVGVPYELGSEQILADMFNACSYISVRNEISKRFLLNTGTNTEIVQIPDTAFTLPAVYSEEDLANERRGLGLKENYIVFQCGKGLPENAKTVLRDIFEKEQSKGYGIVFLPLAYTNQDDAFLSELAREYNLSIKTFPRTLKVKEIAAVLAGCSHYIGLSFHGAITAAVYGVVPILFDYYNQLKTKDLFDYMGIPELRVTRAEELYDALTKEEEIDKEIFSNTVKNIQQELSTHFDTVRTIITADNPVSLRRDTNNYKENYLETLLLLNDAELKKEDFERKFNINTEEIKKKQSEIEQKQLELQEAKHIIAEQQQLMKDYEMDLKNKLELVAKAKKDLETVQFERDLLETFRQEVMHSKSFRLLHMFDKNNKQ